MVRRWHYVAGAALWLLVAAAALGAPATFSVSFDAAVRGQPATGRLVVWLARGRVGLPGSEPADEVNEQDPQPIFGVDVTGLRAGEATVVDDRADGFPAKLSKLPAGWYRAQAVLQVVHQDSDWHRNVGDLYSDVVTFQIDGPRTSDVGAASGGAASQPGPIIIHLSKVVHPPTRPPIAGVQIVEVPSKLLSDFRGEPVTLRAGVVLPAQYDPNRRYPAVYEVPGFGGNHFRAFEHAAQIDTAPLGSPVRLLAPDVFWIVLDPESPNGHTLFADSDNNGPCGKALVTELIPALEARYPLIAKSTARILRGHSSGGWATLWLLLSYPDTFGATWSSSPDPIDFHRLQLSDIYEWDNFFAHNGRDLPSMRFNGVETMTVRQENAIEYVLGPGLTSGQQWASWQAVWGQRLPDGHIQPLFDAQTGVIDHAEAATYRRFDLDALLCQDPQRYAPLWRKRIHLLVGDADTYYLNGAVSLLQADLDRLSSGALMRPSDSGYIRIIPGADHYSLHMTSQALAIPAEMADYLRRHGHMPPAATEPFGRIGPPR
jgi:hypothetical protein